MCVSGRRLIHDYLKLWKLFLDDRQRRKAYDLAVNKSIVGAEGEDRKGLRRVCLLAVAAR